MKESTRKKIAEKIPAWIRNDYSRKIIAILIAIVVLIAVKNQGQPQESIIKNVPVRFELPQNINVKFRGNADPEFHVRITVKGKSSLLRRLTPDRFHLPVKIKEDDIQKGRVSLNPEDVVFNKSFFYDDVEVINVQPAIYDLKLDTIVQRKIPIRIIHNKNDLPKGYSLEEIRVPEDQKYVTVTGPERIVKNYSEIDTVRIPLEEYTQKFNVKMQLVCPDDVTLSFNEVVVTGRITDRETRKMSNVPVRLLLAHPFNLKNINEYKLEPEKVEIIYQEPRRGDRLENAVKGSFLTVVDSTGLSSGSKECQVLYWCTRPDVKIIEVIPSTVTVTVKSEQPNGKTK